MKSVLPHTAEHFARALVMPNIRMPGKEMPDNMPAPPVRTAEDAMWYKKEIRNLCKAECEDFDPLMTISITDTTTPEMVKEASKAGVIAGKAYPVGLTTNSEYGVSDFLSPQITATLSEMERYGMVLCLHGESAGVFCMDREAHFLDTLRYLSGKYRNLKIVLEHVTTAKAVRCILGLPDRVAATITVHHLYLTLDDVVGGMIAPHNFCKPIAKRPIDRAALQRVVLEGYSRFFLGTDSAPHLRSTKECAQGCAGVFMPSRVGLSALVQFALRVSTNLGKVAKCISNFTSVFGASHYGLRQNDGEITLVNEPWVVPAEYEGIVSFMAGNELAWQVAS